MVRGLVAGPQGRLDAELVFEPGRLLVGNAGVLVTRVLYVKDNGPRRFVIIHAAIDDLTRPSLSDASPDIVPLPQPAPDVALNPVDVVGPICGHSDTFPWQRPHTPLPA